MTIRQRKKAIIQLFPKKACNISATCTAIGISRKTFYTYLEKDKKFREAIEESQEAQIDNAESILQKKIMEEDTTSVIFYLKTKGRDRGYIERVEQEVSINPFLELMKVASAEED